MPRLSALSLVLFAALWGVWYFGMDWVGWGEPGSAAYERYELYNRLLPLVLLPLAAALFASRRALAAWSVSPRHRGLPLACLGLLTMTAGSALEFWVHTLAPYAPGSLRGVGWTTYCVGLLVLFLGTASLGAALRGRPALRPAALLLALWLPGAALVAGANRVLGAGLPPLSIAVALCGLGLALYGYHAGRLRPAIRGG